MSQAKYYIYRNLNKGGFSVKHRGLVIANLHKFTVDDVQFQVSDKSRGRAIRERSRNVHAYMTSSTPPKELRWRDETFDKHIDENDMQAVYYNPFKTRTFVLEGTKHKVTSAEHVVARDGKVYVTRTA